MAKVRKKPGQEGASAALISRTRAIRKLGVTLRQFRQLCILKGVFPRPAPSGNAKLRGKTLYLAKDIKFLAHDPIIDHMRQRVIFKRKERKLIGRKETAALEVHERNRPIMRLDHIVRERYPTFADALRGLDDALTLLAVAAVHVGGKKLSVDHCRRAAVLLREFEFFVAETHCLTKCFIARKGLYYQARIEGVDVTWMIPHPFSLPSSNVDYDIIKSFIELYLALVQFVVYKLYKQNHMAYPPKINRSKDADGEYLTAIVPESSGTLVGVAPATEHTTEETTEESAVSEEEKKAMEQRIASLKLDKITADDAKEEAAEEDEATESDNEDDDDEDEIVDEPADEEEKPDEDSAEKKESEASQKKKKHELLFSRCRFFVSREVPRRILEVIILSNGGEISWDGRYAPYPESDPRITHVIMDRDVIPEASLAAAKGATREFVQPQWVFDCANEQMLIPTDKYAPGRQAPPHLSPFVREGRFNYVPERREELQALHDFLDKKKTDAELAESEDTLSSAMWLKQAEEEKRAVEREIDEEMARRKRKKSGKEEEEDEEEEEADTELIDEMLDEEGERERYEAELEAELQGKSYAESSREAARKVKKSVAARKEEERLEDRHLDDEEKHRLVGMMTSKNRRKFLHRERIENSKMKKMKRLRNKRDREIDEKGVQSEFHKQHTSHVPPPLKRPKNH